MWLAALFETWGWTGTFGDSAPAFANLTWLLLLLAGLAGLASEAKGLALLVFLTLLPVQKYAHRFGMEIPFAACVCWALLLLRSPARSRALLAGLCFAGAILTRGVFAGLIPALWWLDARFGPDRPFSTRRRAAAALICGLTLAFLFDCAHRSATGSSFWSLYLQEQVFASLRGTAPHAATGNTWLYYASRLVFYSLPWSLLLLLRLVSQWKRLRPEVPLCLSWIGMVWVGASIADREGSRYLFSAWPAIAVLFAILWQDLWVRRSKRLRAWAFTGALALLPASSVLHSLTGHSSSDVWLHTAHRLELRASYGWDSPEPIVYGPFQEHDDRLRQFTRWHLGLKIHNIPPGGVPAGGLELTFPPEAAPDQETVFTCDLFDLKKR